MILLGYADSERGGSIVDRKSTSDYLFSLGSSMIIWSIKKHGSIAQTIIEGDYIADSTSHGEGVWLRKLLVGLFGEKLDSTVIHCDNQRCINLSEKLVFHDKLKHIEMKYNFIKYMA